MEEQVESFVDKIKAILCLPTEMLVLVSAVIIGVLSFNFNSLLADETGLFARSGSILVFLAALNEFRLRTLRDQQLGYFDPDFVRRFPEEIRVEFRPKVFLGQKIVTYLTHSLALVGTVIWGFGDLFF